MKVLHLAAGNLFGGIETYLLALARLRHLCPALEPQFGVCFPGRLRTELLATGVPVHDLGAVRFRRPWSVLSARRRLRRGLAEHPADAVIAHGTWPHAVFAPAVRRAGAALVGSVHAPLDRGHWLNRWAARTPPDLLVANSRFTAATTEKLFPGVPVATVYLPVELPSVDRDEARHEVRTELGTGHDTVGVLQVGRLERLKGYHVHLEALAKLRAVPAWEVWFVGGPQRSGEVEYLNELHALVPKFGLTGRVRFLGERTDVARLMAAADVYCQPNTGPESFGLTFVEALNAGLPVVTANIGGAREIVTPACGVLCEPGDAGALAGALGALLTDADRRRALGAAGPARAAELCDTARQLAALADALHSLAAARGNR